jgi:hypothetical protein
VHHCDAYEHPRMQTHLRIGLDQTSVIQRLKLTEVQTFTQTENIQDHRAS